MPEAKTEKEGVLNLEGQHLTQVPGRVSMTTRVMHTGHSAPVCTLEDFWFGSGVVFRHEKGGYPAICDNTGGP